jgi:multicomponent Na+:H+ antiporter subunit D
MTKIWNEAFWKPRGGRPTPAAASPEAALPLVMLAPVAALGLVTVVLGLVPEIFMRFALQAADDLLTPSRYVAAVLGGSP